MSTIQLNKSSATVNVVPADAKVGETYPIYGMITNILGEDKGVVTVEVNKWIIAKLVVYDKTKIELLKERAFEPAVFVSTILTKSETQVIVSCNTVLFGPAKCLMN